MGCALTISDCPEFQSSPSRLPPHANHSIIPFGLGRGGWSVSLVQYTGILVDYLWGENIVRDDNRLSSRCFIHHCKISLIFCLCLLIRGISLLLLVWINATMRMETTDTTSLSHVAIRCTYMLGNEYVLAASPSGRNRINMIQSSPQCVPALLHQPPTTERRHTYNRGWHIGSGWRYCQCQVMGNAWCVLVYRETDRETRNCSVPLLRSTESTEHNQELTISFCQSNAFRQ